MSRIKTAVEDLSQLGHIGIIRALVGVIVVLAGLIVFREVQHERGVLKMTDRWTGTDQKAYELVVNRRFDNLETAFDAHVLWGREWIGAHELMPHAASSKAFVEFVEELKEIKATQTEMQRTQTEVLQRVTRIEAKQGP